MNSQTVIRSEALLRRALRANGVFSGLSGLLFMLAAAPIASFIGLPWSWPLFVTGVGLLGYAIALFRVSGRTEIDRRAVVVFISMDVAWVVGSGVLLVTPWIPFTLAGKWAIAIVADMVALFAVIQFYGLRRSQGERISEAD